MKKQVRYILITLVAALVIGAGAWAAITFLPENEKENASSSISQTVQLYQKETVDAVSFEFVNHNDSFSITRKDNGNFQIEVLADYNVSATLINSYADSFCSVKARKKVADSAEDLSLYGLDDPYATVTATFKDETVTLLLGNQESTTSAYYGKLADSDTIYLFNASLATKMMASRKAFVSTQITPTYNSEELVEFERVELSGSVRETPIVIVPTPDTGDEADVFSYEVISPGHAPFDITGGTDFLMSFLALSADSVVELSPDEGVRAAYGFDAPLSVASVESSAGKFTLTVGKIDGDYAFVMNDTDDVIYRVPASAVERWVNAQYPDVVSKIFLVPHINTVKEVEVKTPEKTYVFAVSHDEEKDAIFAKYNGKQINTENFQTYYQVLVSAYLENFTAERTDAEPMLTVTYRYHKGGEDVISFTKSAQDARQALIKLNGEYTDFSVRTVYVDKVIADAAKVAVNEEVNTTW